MKLLSPDSLLPDVLGVTTYFGTAKGISESDCKIIQDELRDFKDTGVGGMHINNKLDCASLFKEYWRSLSLKNA